MDFNEYQVAATKYNTFNNTGDFNDPGFIEKALGLAGESGEAVDKIKKVVRDKGGKPTPDDILAISKELGDVLWYVASLADAMGIKLSTVAEMNIEKLESRYQRNKLHGYGDER